MIQDRDGFAVAVADVQRQRQLTVAGPIELPFEHNLLLLLEIAVVIEVETNFADTDNVAVVNVRFQLCELLFVVFAHVGRVQSYESEDIVREHLHRFGDHRRSLRIHAGEEHFFHMSVHRPLNHFAEVFRIVLAVQVGVGVDVVHLV